jgi:hypothetical protein
MRCEDLSIWTCTPLTRHGRRTESQQAGKGKLRRDVWALFCAAGRVCAAMLRNLGKGQGVLALEIRPKN